MKEIRRLHSVFVPKEEIWAVFEDHSIINREKVVSLCVYESKEDSSIEFDAMVIGEDGLADVAQEVENFLGLEIEHTKPNSYWEKEMKPLVKKRLIK
jgi:hypothetical protein